MLEPKIEDVEKRDPALLKQLAREEGAVRNQAHYYREIERWRGIAANLRWMLTDEDIWYDVDKTAA